jgi:hypothetical protein
MSRGACGITDRPFESANRTILWIDGLANVPEPTFLQHALRSSCVRKSVGSDKTYFLERKSEIDQCLGGLSRVAFALVIGMDAVGNLDDATYWWTLEAAAAYGGASVSTHHPKGMRPWVSRL